jgi:hypothetical protein
VIDIESNPLGNLFGYARFSSEARPARDAIKDVVDDVGQTRHSESIADLHHIGTVYLGGLTVDRH